MEESRSASVKPKNIASSPTKVRASKLISRIQKARMLNNNFV